MSKHLAIINTVTYGSTGRIMLGIADTAREAGMEVRTYAKKWDEDEAIPGNTYFGTKFENRINSTLSRITGISDVLSLFGTLRLIRELKRWDVDCIHLHNLHGWYLSFPLLFRFIKKRGIRVIWTLHDAWPVTGKCTYFIYPPCSKWQESCGGCGRLKEYPSSLLDATRFMLKLKKRSFLGVADMTLVTPSQWLADLVRPTFLGQYQIRVIHNGIDLEAFAPKAGDFREKHALAGKKLVLGVAFQWETRKGLDVFQWLARRLPEDYAIVLVGTNEETDRLLPENVLSIHRTHDTGELAEIYSAADVFVNPTREDNFPTTNLEALACGTPVITFKTGGSPEMLSPLCGSVVERDDLEGLAREIERVCTERPYTRADCRRQAEKFEKKSSFRRYVELYTE